MSNELYERNKARLAEILSPSGVNIEKHLDNFERTAINCGDLKRAIRYNWLRNTYKRGLLDDDMVFFQLLTIQADTYIKGAN